MKKMYDHTRIPGIPVTARGRPWAVTMIGRMLIIETLLLFLLGMFHLQGGSQPDSLPAWFLWALRALSIRRSVPLAAVFWFLSLWAAVTSMLFIRMAMGAWLHAVSLQCALLAFMIVRYYTGSPVYCYILMVYAAWLVVYLHYSEVETVFHAPARQERDGT